MSTRTFWLLYAGLGAIFVVPLWLVVHPPAMDLTGHLALATVIATRWTESDPFAGYFTLPLLPSPNMLYYYITGMLGRILPVYLVSKLLLSAAILTTPLALAYARRVNRHSPGLALVGFGLAATFNLVAGFIGFALALPLMLWLMGLARAQIEVPTARRAAAIAAVACLTYLTHAHVFMFALGLVGLVALCGAWGDGTPVRRMLATFCPTLVAVAMATPWYIDRVRLMSRAGGMKMHFPTLETDLAYLPIHTYDNLRGNLDMLTGVIMTAGLLALAVVALLPWYRQRPRSPADWLRQNAYYLGALCAAIAYFVMPSSVRFQQVINGRQAVVTLMIFAAAVPLDPLRRVPRLLRDGTLIACLAYGLVFATATVRLGQETGDFRALLDQAGDRTKLIAVHMPQSKVFRISVYRHIASYHVPWNHGLVANNFATVPIQPIRVTRKWHMPRFSLARIRAYDHILSGKPIHTPMLRLLATQGPFHLYAVAK